MTNSKKEMIQSVFYFDTMLTPKVITFIYWFMLASTIISGLGVMFSSDSGSFFTGLGIVIGGSIATRLWCELLIVLFKINDNLQKIADSTKEAEVIEIDAKTEQ